MKIILDCMGSDNAPQAQVLGACEALEEYGDLRLVLVGDQEAMKEAAGDRWDDLSGSDMADRVEFVQTSEVITMEDPALSVVRTKTDSSMAIALHMLKNDDGDALVSAGNTGALHAGSSLIVRRIKGVKRSAIASILPFQKPLLLIDSGANLEVDAEQMHQFGMMGSIYMERLFGCSPATVGLLNVGTEATKGSKNLLDAYALLDGDPDISFVGNVEGKTVPLGSCDVLVTDGFSGNVLLKMSEGLSKFILSEIKDCFMANPVTKLSALALKPRLSGLKESFDASSYGGAPLLGLSKPVIKAHGSSDPKAIRNAIRYAAEFAKQDVIFEISERIRLAEEKAAAEPAPEETGTEQ